MEQEKFFITPQTKLAEILDRFPEAEKVFVEISPEFAKITNPVLRKTVVKIATMGQVAKIGNMSIEELINILRKKLPVESAEVIEDDQNGDGNWIGNTRVGKTLDARPMLARGEHPVDQVLREVKTLAKDEMYLLITSFLPAPLLDAVEKQGFKTHSVTFADGTVNNYIKHI